jgi:hypothetical protein
MPGKETIVLVDITQPQCTRTYGSAPCTASLGTTGTRKCFNTRVTCQDSAHYLASPIVTRYSLPNDGLFDFGPIIPALSDIPQITPGVVNIGGADENASALGVREKVSLRLTDLQHSDLGFDKYRLERATGAAQLDAVGYEPYWRGTLWGKWLARNPYYVSYPAYSMTVYRGYVGDDIADFDQRTYVIDSVSKDDGKVTITGKDLFTKLDDKKAVAPLASPGYLSADINNSQTSAVLAPAGIGNLSYPASGYGRIGDECVSFTRSGDNLTIARGLLGTSPDQHSHDDTFQLVLAYSAQTAQAIVADLLTNYTEIPASSVSLSDWNTAAANAGMINNYTTYVTSPTPVADLVGELAVQAGFTLYPDTSDNTIKFFPLVAGTAAFTVTDDWIVGDTLKTRLDDVKRVSQVWVYYGMKDFTKDIEEETNYSTRVFTPDFDAEDPTQYGTAAVRKIFSRWIPQFGRASAISTADRIISMFRDPPLEATYEVHKDRVSSFTLASIHNLQVDVVQNDDGSAATTVQAVTSVAPKENTVEISTIEVSLQPPSDNRDIYIDVDTANVNVRAAYDLLYTAPTGVEDINVFVNAAAYATDTAGYGLDTGTFPAGCTITIILSSAGRICGAGGSGGNGGSADSLGVVNNGNVGQPGGTALKVRQAITLGGSGEVNGGGGGGGGGGGAKCAAGFFKVGAVGGSGGGGGRGVSQYGSAGDASGPGWTDGGVYSIQHGNNGDYGGLSGPGAGGASVQAPNPPRVFGGAGGIGGDWASTGVTGVNGAHSDSGADGAGAAGGAAGKAIEGNSFITYQGGNTITIRGATV